MRKQARVVVVTGGGDAVGLNAAIAGLTRDLTGEYYLQGIIGGWKGFAEFKPRQLTLRGVDGIVRLAGTILQTSRENPCQDEEKIEAILQNLSEQGTILVAAGGDDTLGVALTLFQRGIPVIGIPKTMDLDLNGTDYSVGFWSYVQSVTDLAEGFITTLASHQRVGVLEVFGRYSGFTATAVGIAVDADYIIIPEFELDIDQLTSRVKAGFKQHGRALVIMGEGLKIESADQVKIDGFGRELLCQKRLGEFIARQIEEMTGIESRSYQASHPHRGVPQAYDCLVGYRFGLKAADLVREEKWGRMVAMVGDAVTDVPLESFAPRRLITPDSWWGELVLGRNSGKT